MLSRRPAAERGHTRLSWLDSRHSFSFGSYDDPAHRGFRALRVLNDDRVAPGTGFDAHPHRDAEILTFVLEGVVEHRDSEGSHAAIEAGALQRMNAGSGIVHSEQNPSRDRSARFLQVWLAAAAPDAAPGYEEGLLARELGRFELVASSHGEAGAVSLAQDARVYEGRFRAGDRETLSLAPDRHAWVQVATGSLRLGELSLAEGDGVAVSEETTLAFDFESDSQVLVFDLA